MGLSQSHTHVLDRGYTLGDPSCTMCLEAQLKGVAPDVATVLRTKCSYCGWALGVPACTLDSSGHGVWHCDDPVHRLWWNHRLLVAKKTFMERVNE